MKKSPMFLQKNTLLVRGLFAWKRHKGVWSEFEAEGRTWKQEPWEMFGLTVWTVPITFKSEGQADLEIDGASDRGSFTGTVSWKGQTWNLTSNSVKGKLTDSSGSVVAQYSTAWQDSDALQGITHYLEKEDSLDPVLAAVLGGLAGGAILARE